jgi:hypothetical protein
MARLSKNLLVAGLLVVANCVCSSGQTKPEAASTTPTRALDVTEIDGGNIANAEYGTVLHKNTSLHRKWYVLNDHTCPVQLSGAGVTPVSTSAFLLKGDATTSVAISAIEVVAVLFDLWGDHLMNLDMLKVTDFGSNATFPLSDPDSKWLADEHTVKQCLTSATYVRRVRLTDGKIWLADMPAILRQITDAHLKVSKEELEVKPTAK